MTSTKSDRGSGDISVQAMLMDWGVDRASDSDSESSGAVTPTAPIASGTSGEPSEASASSPLQSPGEAFLDAAVSRLLKNQPAHDPNTAGSESREAADAHALSNLESLHCTGDTLVVVEFPTNAPPYVNCAGTYWRSKTFRAPSAVLLATGSSFFAKLYSPRAQARVRRRFDPSKWGPDIEYVLDLTPSSEGDELAAQLAELSIPEGVRNWWLSMQRLDVSRFLVSGHDDHCPQHLDVPIEYATQPNSVASAANPHIGNTHPPRDDLEDIEPSWLRIIPDYCPVRHRANIIRLIRAILGEDLVLNSAARVYTISGIARQFDCAGVIRDSVFTWLVAQPNSDFIDIEPETALRIGWNLGLRDITRVAMRIIVVENTMDALSSTPRASRRHTLLGRARAELPDELENIIQHATAKFAERLTQLHADFASPRVYSLLGVGEWKNLMALGEIIGTVSPGNDVPMIDLDSVTRLDSALNISAHIQDIRSLYNLVCKELLNFVRAMVDDVDGTSFRSDTETNTENSRLCYVPRSRFTSYFSVWHSLSTLQRGVLTDYWKRFADTIWAWTSTDSNKTILYPALAGVRRLNVVVSALNSSLQLASNTDMFPPLTDCTYKLDLNLLKVQLAAKLGGISRSWAHSKAVGTAAVAEDTPWAAADLEIPISRSRHLVLGLTDEEFKYLPLWAGGLDDGTGGVFHEPLPDAEMGPIGPGPAYHTGYSVLSSSACTDADVSSIAPSDAPTMSMFGTEEGDDIGFGGVGVGRDPDDDEDDVGTPTSGRSRVAVPTGSTVTGTRAASPYAPSSVMTPSEGGSGGGSVISSMARDISTMRLATAPADGGDGCLDSHHTAGKTGQQSPSNDANDEMDDGDDEDEDDWSAPSDDDDDDLDNYV